MKNLLLLSALFISFHALGQSTEDRPVRVCENMLSLRNVQMKIQNQQICTQMTVMQLVADEINYPTVAQSAGVEGTAYVSFIVEKDGSVNEVKLMRGPGDSEAQLALSAEAVRAVRLLPDFTPGTDEKGKAIRVNFVTPVRFLLSK